MRIQKLKGKRVSKGFRQVDIAKALCTSEKTFNEKENSVVCKFSVDEIIKLAGLYELDIYDVNDIFFESELPNGKRNEADTQSKSKESA